MTLQEQDLGSASSPPAEEAAREVANDHVHRGRRSVLRRFRRDKFAVGGLIFLLLLAVVAIAAPLVARYDPNELSAGGAANFAPPSWSHWLGADSLGRDNLSRIVYGARYALRDAIQVVALTLVLAVPIGLIAGFRRGWRDTLAMRVMDGIQSIPSIVLVLAVAQVANQQLSWALVAVSIGFVPTMARLVRGATLAVREEVFIEASMSIGTSNRRILLRRVLPNVVSPIIVQSSIIMGSAIFVQAALAILGIGYPVGVPAWGSMLNDAYRTIYTSFWNMFYPGMAIALTVLAFNVVGDGLRDAFGLDRGNLYGSRVRLGITEAVRVVRGAETQPEAAAGAPTAPLLEVDGLTVQVKTADGWISAVEDLSFSVRKGEVLGLVGESGAGKSVTSLALMRLLPCPPFRISANTMTFDGQDLLSMSLSEMRGVRGNDIAMIFQDPMMALNPAYTVGHQIAEAVEIHEGANRHLANRRALEMLERVGIPDPRRAFDSYPHEFSGGMRQRAVIAIALACSPRLLIADEPTTALDVTVQAQILDLLRDLQEEFGLAVIFVTHDLGIVAEFCDRVVVMYAGQLVEHATTPDLFAKPAHPYTGGLLRAVPRLGPRQRELAAIPGQVPPIDRLPSGCRFHPRCAFAVERCASEDVPVLDRSGSLTRCIRAFEIDPRGAA